MHGLVLGDIRRVSEILLIHTKKIIWKPTYEYRQQLRIGLLTLKAQQRLQKVHCEDRRQVDSRHTLLAEGRVCVSRDLTSRINVYEEEQNLCARQ